MDDVRDQPTRRRILDFVTSHPGASAREIQRSLALAWGETAYHLEKLLEASALQRDRAGRRDSYFPAGFGPEDRRLLTAFQSPAERALLLELARNPGRSFAELVSGLTMGKSTLAFHLKFLLAVGLVRVSPEGGVRRYHAADPTKVLESFRRYRESWGDRWIDRFTDAFGGLVRD